MKMEKEGKEEQAHESMSESIAEQQYYESEAEMAKSSAEVLHKAIEGLTQVKLKDAVAKKCTSTVTVMNSS